MRDHFATFWAKVASSLKDKKILGYEIINEPWCGDIYSKPSLLLPGVAGAENLQPLYDVIAAAIREVDTNHIIFYEPVTWGMIFNGTVTGSGFTHVPGGEQFADKSVFSFHYYCWWWSPDGQLTKETCDKMFGPKIFDQATENVRIMGGSAMMTEWGLGCDPGYSGYEDECAPIMDLADEHLISWTDWWWTGPLMSGWNVKPEAVAVYSRTFAQSVAGTPTKMKYNSKNQDFELCFQVDPSISAPTEIYFNGEVHYPSGVRVLVTGSAASKMKVDVVTNRVLITYESSESPFPDSLSSCVYITKK
jgi:endoglycosylceramidase